MLLCNDFAVFTIPYTFASGSKYSDPLKLTVDVTKSFYPVLLCNDFAVCTITYTFASGSAYSDALKFIEVLMISWYPALLCNDFAVFPIPYTYASGPSTYASGYLFSEHLALMAGFNIRF